MTTTLEIDVIVIPVLTGITVYQSERRKVVYRVLAHNRNEKKEASVGVEYNI